MPYKLIAPLLCALVLALSGCMTAAEVKPDERPSLAGTGKALLTTDSGNKHLVLSGLDERVHLVALDNKSLYRIGAFSDFPQAMLVEPGRHTLVVRYNHLNQYADATISFDAKLERTYVVRKVVADKLVTFWIEDAESGESVSVGGRRF